MNTMKFMVRARNNLLPLICKNYIQLNYIIHIYFKVRTDRKAFCLSIIGPRL